MAFTQSDLNEILNTINTKVRSLTGSNMMLKCSPRNGYYGLDVYVEGKCQRTVTTAKYPKDLIADAYQWGFNQLTD